MIKLINGELFRVLREKKYKKNIYVLFLSVVGCFAFLVCFERGMQDLSKGIFDNFQGAFSGAASYNFGLFKIWDIQSIRFFSMKEIFNAIIPSGNIALFVGLFGMNYAHSFRKQTCLFLESYTCRGYEITAVLVLMEAIIANFYTLIYEISVGIICVFWGMYHRISYDWPHGFGVWLLCLHINITAFTLFVSMVNMIVKKRQVGILLCVSVVLAGSSCIGLLKMIFHLPDSVGRFWVLNNVMDLSVESIGNADIMGISSAAAITSFLAVGLILLEISLNSKERYK